MSRTQVEYTWSAARNGALAGMWLLCAACAPKVAPPPADASDMPSEASFREACDAGVTDACMAIGVLLARGEWGPAREADAAPVLNKLCAADEAGACLASYLLFRAHPELSTPETFEAAERGACLGSHPYACRERAVRLTPTDPAGAMAAWKMGCDAGSAYACAIVEGAWPAPARIEPPLPQGFVETLARAHMRFEMPPGFTLVPTHDNPDLFYQLAMQSDDGEVELRYRVDPLDELQTLYDECQQKPGCVAAKPDAVAAGLAMATAHNIASVEPPGASPFPEPAVFLEFNADRGELSTFVPRPSFAPDWPFGVLITLHRDGVGLGTVVLLFKDPERSAIAWEAAFHALRFADPHGP